MKKVLALIIVAAILCSGCALAAGLVVGEIGSQIIKHTTGIFKGEDDKAKPQNQDLLRDKNVLEIK